MAIKKYMEGKSGWYFLDNDRNRVVQEITGGNKYSRELALKWKAVFIKRQAKADELNVSLVTFIVPNKHCVLPDFLPDEIELSNDRLVKIIDCDQYESVIYDTAMFKGETAFHKNDTHWTDHGSYLAFTKIMAEFNLSIQSKFGSSHFESRFCKGDLTATEGTEKALCLKDEYRVKEIYDNGIVHVGRVRLYRNDKIKGNGKKIAIFGGSSTNQIKDYFANEFELVVHVWSQSIDWDVVEAHGCSYVLALPRERFMVEVATDDMRWEYQQKNALKFLTDTSYDLSSVTGRSAYFGHIGYRNSIDLVALSLHALECDGESVYELLSRYLPNLDRRSVEGVLSKLEELDVSDALLEAIKSNLLLMDIKELSGESRLELFRKLKFISFDILDADILRDSAIQIEKSDVDKSRYLMGLAAIKRPKGPVISGKILAYDKLLNKEIKK